MTILPINKRGEEKFSTIFWNIFKDNQIIKITNSITDKVEEFENGVIDMEEVIELNGTFDKYDIEKQVNKLFLSKQLELLKIVIKEIKEMKGNKEHICIFNDGEQICECMDKTLSQVIELLNKTIKENE